MLARIREALTVSAPAPGQDHDGPVRVIAPSASMAQAREWLPSVGATFEDRLNLFRKNATDLKAAFHLVNDPQELGMLLAKLRDAEGWRKIGSHRGDLADLASGKLGLPICRTDIPYDVRELESCDAGITECDALVAQTGSVLVTGRSAGGRALSVLPPHHVVLARRGQLLGDLPEAFAFLKNKYALDYPSFISFITGPSRTGDIERILVLGAHGPKKLTIFCL